MIKKFEEFNINESLFSIDAVLATLSIFTLIQMFKFKYGNNIIRLTNYLNYHNERAQSLIDKGEKDKYYYQVLHFLYSECLKVNVDYEQQNTFSKIIRKIIDSINGKGSCVIASIINFVGYDKFIEITNSFLINGNPFEKYNDLDSIKDDFINWLNSEDAKRYILNIKNEDVDEILKRYSFKELKKVWKGE